MKNRTGVNASLLSAAVAVLGISGYPMQSVHAEDGALVEGFTLEEVVVTARRREESLLDVPESISVFGEQLITDAEINEIADFAQLTPGVVVQQGFQGGDRPIVVFRGIGQIGGSAPSVVILSDGIYLPGGDPLRNQLFDIQQIEVVKGPQGSLYGRDTIGGVINVISKEPDDVLGGVLQASYLDEAKEKSLKGAINVPLIDGVLYTRLSAGHLKSDGFFVNASGSDQDFREESYIRNRILFMPTSNVTVDARIGYNEYDNGYNAAFFSTDADTYYDDVGSLNAVDYSQGFNKREVLDGAIKVEIEFEESILTSITQSVSSEQNLVQDADFGLAPGLQIVRDSETEEDSWSQELRLASSGDTSLRWLVGVFYEDTETSFKSSDNELNLLGLLSSSSNGTDAKRHAVFSQFDYDVSDRLTASLALRYDDTERNLDVITPVASKASASSYMTTPKFSLTYGWTDEIKTYITYAEGFRSGGFDPITTLPFNDEELASYELGFKSVLLDGRLSFNAAAYFIDYTDQQVSVLTRDSVTNNLITTTENLGKSETKGIELELQYLVSESLSVNLAADVMDTEIKEDPNADVLGNQTPFSTDYTLSASGQHTLALSSGLDMVSRLSYYYQGDQTWDKGNTMVQDAYGTLAARIAIQSEDWFVALSGENLLDEDYNDQIFTNFGVVGQNAVYPGLPRRWTVTVSTTF